MLDTEFRVEQPQITWIFALESEATHKVAGAPIGALQDTSLRVQAEA
jgi:hypothetical protein